MSLKDTIDSAIVDVHFKYDFIILGIANVHCSLELPKINKS